MAVSEMRSNPTCAPRTASPCFWNSACIRSTSAGWRAPDVAAKACDFLSKHADLKQGIPLIFPSARNYPLASHMEPGRWSSPRSNGWWAGRDA